MRGTKKPPLFQNEQIILQEQGGCKNNSRSGWKLGHYYLTNKRLLFSQASGLPTGGAGIIFEILLERITKVTVEKRFFVLRGKDVICLSYKPPGIERILKAWIIMANLEKWRKKIYEMTAPPINEETISEVAQELDPVSQEILWYLWQNEHATINELTELVEAPTHMDVLLKIRENINSTAEKIIGGPILAFEKSKIDPETGERVLFSWWLIGRQQEEMRGKAPMDIFDEGDHIGIVAELVGIEEEDILLEVEKDRLTIIANTLGKKYDEEILLPAKVNTKQFTKKYNNNILEVRLKKAKNCKREKSGR